MFSGGANTSREALVMTKQFGKKEIIYYLLWGILETNVNSSMAEFMALVNVKVKTSSGVVEKDCDPNRVKKSSYPRDKGVNKTHLHHVFCITSTKEVNFV